MPSIKVIIRKAKKDGTHPIAIDIIKDRKHVILHLGYSVKADDWDKTKQRVKKSHPNSVQLNHLISQKIAETSDKVIAVDTKKQGATVRNVRDVVKRNNGGTFRQEAKLYLDNLEATGKFNSYSAEKPRIKRFLGFVKGDIAFSDISVGLIKQFKIHLKSTRDIGDRTVENHVVIIRSIFNQAIENGSAELKHYPFGKGKVKIKFPSTTKIGLNIEEIKTLKSVELSPFLDQARDIWLFSFYFAGARVSDVLRTKLSDFQNDRFYYKMGKNSKADSLRIPEKALPIIEKYRGIKKHGLLFDDLTGLPDLEDEFEVKKYIKTRVKSIDGALKEIAGITGIDKPLTMHIARHSFAQLAGKIPIKELQKMFRHTSLTTTANYMGQFNNEMIDNSLDEVLKF